MVIGALVLGSSAAHAADGLLFRVSGDESLTADVARGEAVPNFLSNVRIVRNGKQGGAIAWADDGYVAWNAPGNIFAQRGTLAFFWRSRTPVGAAPFVLFRVGFADHSSWDMAFLRIDWNGHGFDAFVTDANLARKRVSFRMATPPTAEAWTHLAFAWDEARGVRLYVDGKEVARQDGRADLDAGLDQLGLAGRVLSPHQVQSRYNFMRGSDLDEIRVYDHALAGGEVAVLAGGGEPEPETPAYDRTAWLHRFGWDHGLPPELRATSTRFRKIEFSAAKDLKQEMWKGVDGIAETTWPGVYNRSRLAGRDDYFELPDWNTYVEGGKAYDLTIPAGERVNRVELRGAAYGTLGWSADGASYATLAKRPAGVVRSVDTFVARTGGRLRFINVAQETPIQEIWAYDVADGAEPEGTRKLSYTVAAKAAPALAALAPLNAFIAGRYPAGERATVVAFPPGANRAAAGAGSASATGAAERHSGDAPIVHVLIPSGFGDAFAGRPIARAWNYGWENVHDGLDGIALDIPALNVTSGSDGLIALNIRVKDPIWPARDLIDVSVSVKPGQARTVWLDTRDRILTSDSLYLTVASSAADFGAESLDGMAVRLVFKDRAEAAREHVADRFRQVKDNWGFLVEEHTSSKREGLYRRLLGDVSDLLRVDPDHLEGRRYWADISYGATGWPKFTQPVAPAGVPLWAFRQLEDLKLVRHFVNWWIDERQVPYGDFGGGISDDTDLTGAWPGLALMGVDSDKINASQRALSDAVYTNGMKTNGLSTIETDELHAYEEGLNSDAERLYLNWGEPKTIERLMETTRALQRVILTNPAGHLHFASNWYGGKKIYREGPWEWQKPYSWVVLHAPVLLGVYNASPPAVRMVTGLVDGLLAHGSQDKSGIWSFPNEINWRSDATRVGDGGGATLPIQSAWAAWRFTGNEKYLRPLLSRVAKAGPGSVAELNENVVGLLGKDWTFGTPTGDFDRYTAWNASGDTKWLEALHADAIADKTQHQYMLTEGHMWSDRVDQPNEILQRERLGGIALKRNQTYPGNTVSWRFADPEAAVQVALLVQGATREKFRVIAWNTTDKAQPVTMSTWNVTAGRWKVTGPGGVRELPLERGGSADVIFAPGESVLEFVLVEPVAAPETRGDLGIGSDDVVRTGRTVTVTVHSLGAVGVTGGSVLLEDADGREIARAAVPALAAPTDLLPKTARVSLAVPANAVRVRLASDAPEVTTRNNAVPLR